MDIIRTVFGSDAEEVWFFPITFVEIDGRPENYRASYIYREGRLERSVNYEDMLEGGRMPARKIEQILRKVDEVGVSEIRREMGERDNYEYGGFYVLVFAEIDDNGARVVVYVMEENGGQYSLFGVTEVDF